MTNEKTSVFSNGLIWFGAAVSIAEILTGTFIAPLGFQKGIAAILLGHAIGCILFYLAGYIGAKEEKSAMETVKMSFGKKGSFLFSSLNVLQLVGWTAVMIISGAQAASAIFPIGDFIWCFLIGLLIILWIAIGIKHLSILNTVAMLTLFILTIVLSVIVFRGKTFHTFHETIRFGSAVELAVAMPLSWLPLISDYTRFAKKKVASTLTSTVVYFLVSSWMFTIGMGASIFTGEGDIAKIMTGVGLGFAGLIIVIFSTVTTTFLDVYSASVSCESIFSKIKEKPTAIVICIIGMLLSVFTPIAQYENFLYLIGSVFAPMISILIVDYFIYHHDYSQKAFAYVNLILWGIGFVLYRLFMYINTPLGNTFPVMLITALLCIVMNQILGGKKHV